MKKTVLIMTLLYCAIVFCRGQSTVITGNIKDTNGEAVFSAMVVLKNLPDSAILAYTLSDASGNYRLTHSGAAAEFLLTVSAMGIESQAKKIQNKSQTVNFSVKRTEIYLKEVIIKARPITYRKDTINYLVSAFATSKDFIIGDVLKKMPGISVSSSGQISYQGKNINRFYIENMDMLGGRYGIATNNIPAKDVQTVQVLENHQPIKAKDSLEISDQAAINLKLKNAAKGTFSIMALLGIGYRPVLWNNEMVGMHFAGKMQHLSTYKTNNSGNNLADELRSFSNDFNLYPEQLTSVQTPTPPAINQDRYLFNNSHAGSVNNLFKIAKDKELNINIIYFNDYEKRSSDKSTNYFITKDSLLNINEAIRSFSTTNRLESEIRYNQNAETKYLNNLLKLEGMWEQDRGEIQLPETIRQTLNQPSFKVQNTLNFIKRLGEIGYEFSSHTGFVSSPQSLIVSPGLYADIINQDEQYGLLHQDVRSRKFISENNMFFTNPFMFGNIKINPGIGINIEMNRLFSELYPGTKQMIPDSMKNDIRREEISPSAGFQLMYMIGHFTINGYVPVRYHIYMLDNFIFREKGETLKKFFIEPNLSVKYNLNLHFSASASYVSFFRITDINELFSSYILQSYRFMNSYNSRFAKTENSFYTFNTSYKNIIKMFFANITLNYNITNNSVMSVQNFNDNLLMFTSVVDIPNENNSFSVSGKMSKGFDFMKLTADLEINRYISNSSIMWQGDVTNAHNLINGAKFKVNAVPVSFLIFSYMGAWQKSDYNVENQQSYPSIISSTNTLGLDFTIIKNAGIGAKFEQYNNSSLQIDKNLYFGDFNLNYSLKKFRFELACNNILNTKSFIIANYSELNAFRYNYIIRPSQVLLKVRFKLK